MIGMIDGADESVALECYILKSDSVGMRFAVALARAAKRGVEVRLLADWFGMRGIKSSYLRNLRRRGVQVRVFNPLGFRPWLGGFPRDHRKLLVVDSAEGLTGGIGIGDEWQGGLLRRRRLAWRDTCVNIAGPAADGSHGDIRPHVAARRRRAAAALRTEAHRAPRAARISIRRTPRRPSSASSKANPGAFASGARFTCRPPPRSARSGWRARTSCRRSPRSRR